MPGTTPAHPTAKHLTDFAQGRLTPAQAETISKHLASCPDCLRAVEKVPSDSFGDLVRSARNSRTQLPDRQLQDVAMPPHNRDLPVELVNHSKFRIEKELGRGGMGVVYKAEHLHLGKAVAIKVITRGMSDHPDALKRFQQEVRAAGKLDHPNIVKALDADQAGNLHLLVMDYVDGLDLNEVLQKKGSLLVLHACEYIRQAALGLQHAHEQGMIHRDIKPKNLMLTRKGQVKILDFGLAGMTDDKSDTTKLTKLGSFMGTVEYMAPEQAEDATKADIRSDIYSLGCTLYCLLAGQPPFVRETDVKTILAHLGEEARPLHEVRPDVPGKLSALVAKMLAKEPDQRFQTPIEVVQALREFCKPGAKSGPRPILAQPSEVRPSEKGTVIGANIHRDTSVKEQGANLKVAPFAEMEVPSPKPASLTPKQLPPGGQKPRGKRGWLIGSGMGVLAVLVGAGIVAMWAAGFFSIKTPTDTSVGDVSKPTNANVTTSLEKEPRNPAGGTNPVRIVSSTFALRDDEGWTTSNRDNSPDATTHPRVRVAPNGKTFLEATDLQNGLNWGWRAPAKYRGNHLDKYGKLLKYGIWTDSVDNLTPNGWSVRLQGAGMTLIVDDKTLGVPIAGRPKSVSIRLDPQGGWKKFIDKGNRVPATEDEIKTVLAKVTELWIRGEYSDKKDVGRLDNVEFGAEP